MAPLRWLAVRPTDSDRHAALAVLVATLGGFAALEWLHPYYFLWDDNASFFLPAYVHDWRTLFQHGALAHINPHQYLGQIWLGNGQSGVLYPPVYLAAGAAELLWGDLRPTIDLLVIGHLGIAAAGMFFLLRGFGVGRGRAVLAGLLWVTFPFLVQVSKNWVFVSYAAALWPWNLLLLEHLRRRPTAGRALALATLKAVLFLQGYVQYAVLVALGDGLYLAAALFAPGRDEAPTAAGARHPEHGATVPRAADPVDSQHPRSAWRVIAAYGAALLMTGLLAAPLLLPMWQAKALSADRAKALSFAEFVSNAMPLGAAAGAQVGLMEPRVIHGATGAIFFVGPAVLTLVALAFLPRLRRVVPASPWPSIFAALGCLVLASPAWGLLHQVPLLNSFRWPFKTFLLVLGFATVAAALAAEAWARAVPAGRRWGSALLGLGLAMNVAVLLHPAYDRPFGPYRVDRAVDELRREAAATIPSGGRVISLWQRHDQPAMPRHLTLAFATLVGAHHIGGYDPLIAAENLRLALDLEYSNIFRFAVDERVLEHTGRWGVRTLIAPAEARYRAALARVPGLNRRYGDAEIEVWENPAALPLVSFRDRPEVPVPFRWTANGLRIRIDNDRVDGATAGSLRVALAPLPWWFVSIDGEDRGAAAIDEWRQLRVELPATASEVEIRYVDVPFRLGVVIAGAFAVLALGAVGFARIRRRRDRR